ncbi:MAG TPA: inositol monophosphatase family protein [Pyrinomonadaceae bacterium]
MNQDKSELEALLDFAVGLARGAGEITLRHFRQSFTPERKADGSFVTQADREAERFIRARIEEKFPHDSVLGEEEEARAGSSGRQWIIDPIDGTYSFVHGVPLYGVLIALEIADETCLGVVNLPALDDLVYAARGLGCFRNDDRARVSETASLADALLLSTDFGTCERYGFAEAARRLEQLAGARRTWGDCYGHILVATGRADVMLDPVMNVWDCAPLLPILEEAGGTFTDWHGRRTVRGGNAISTNGLLFEAVLDQVEHDV